MNFLECITLNPKISLKKGKIYPFIEMGNVSTSYRNPIVIQDKAFNSGVKFQDGDTVIARITPCLQNGKRFYCKDIGTGFGSTEYLVFRPKDKSVDNLYLYYYMKTDFIRQSMINSMTGATGRQRVNNEIFKDIEVDFPNIKTQRKIGEILSTYDDFIENNQKKIKLLEETAQRLYKEWFVDLRFPGYESVKVVDGMPEGWKKDRADSFFNITIGKTPPRTEKQWFVTDNTGIPWLSISDMGNSGVFAFEINEGLTDEAVKKYNMKVVPAGTIFVSFKLTVGRVAISTTDMCTNEAIAHFYIENSIYRAYTYCYLKNFQYDTLGNTSSISKAVNSKIIKAMPFLMPVEDIVTAFSKQVEPVLKEIENNQAACIKLVEARDRLLPKLMSGELEV